MAGGQSVRALSDRGYFMGNLRIFPMAFRQGFLRLGSDFWMGIELSEW